MDVRKFGLAHHDLPTMITNVATFLRLLSLDIDSRNKKKIPIFCNIVTVITASAYVYTFWISCTWFLVFRCLLVGDIIRAIIIFSLTDSSSIGTAKLIYCYIKKKDIRKMIEEYLIIDASVTSGSRIAKNILKVLSFVKRRAVIFWLVIMANGTVYVSKAVFTPGRHFMDDLYTLYGLEPITDSPNFEIGYSIMAASVWFLCYVPANVTGLHIILSGYIEAQMLALSYELSYIWEDAVQYYNTLNFSILKKGTSIHLKYRENLLNEIVQSKLESIVVKHASIMYLRQLVEDVFRGATAIEFLLLVMGLIAELLGGLENTYLEVPYALVQVAMDCYTGQKVMDASKAFEDAVYACNWEEFNVSNRKMVLMMLRNSQKTMTLNASSITTLSFNSFMNIVRSIYSTYTALRSTLKK